MKYSKYFANMYCIIGNNSYICENSKLKLISLVYMRRIKGLIVAPFTAFTPEGDLDLSKVTLQQKFYRDNGVSGVFACGTTGESSSLTLDEKKALLSEWAKYRRPDFAVIGFVGGTSVREAQDLARFAASCGLDAVAMTAPYYQKAANVRDLALTLAEVASAVPEMPFYYYHIPVLTHVCFPMIELLREVDRCIPNFAGIKYTFEDLMDFQLCLEFKDRKYNMMYGRDEMLLPALSLGAEAFIGSTYGYSAPVYLAAWDAFRKGEMEEAARLQLEANRLITFLGKYGSGAGKAFMKAAGLDLGPCRRPLRTLTDGEYASMVAELQDTAFDRCKCVFK